MIFTSEPNSASLGAEKAILPLLCIKRLSMYSQVNKVFWHTSWFFYYFKG